MKETFGQLVDHLMHGGFSMDEAVGILEKTMIGRALDRFEGNQSEASKALGIHRNTLRTKMEAYGISNGVRRKAPAKARPAARKRASA